MKVSERIQQRLQHTSGSKHGFLEPYHQVCLHEFYKLQLSIKFCKFSHQDSTLSKGARDILSNSPWTRTSDQVEAVCLQMVYRRK